MHHSRLVLLILLLTWTAPLLLVAQEEQPNFYGVIIGVSEFEYLPKEEWLDFADDDARDFYKVITSPRGRAFPPENVYLMTDQKASFYAIRKKLGSTLAKKVKRGDTVYIFIATHGMVEKEVSREGYLLAHDSDREDLYISALAMKDLGNIMQSRLRKARRVFLFADACRAGKLGQVQGRINRYIEDVSKSEGETLGLLASRPNEFSREGPQFGGGHGVFTYYLLKGMMGEADADGDETVNATELVDYLDEKVEEATDRQQHVREFGTFEAETPITFIDKPGPQDLQLGQLPRPRGTEIASLPVISPESSEVRIALQQALREGRLLAPSEDNAWDLYQRYTQLSVSESEKEDVQDDLFIALATAGDRVLSTYRRGDQVIRLDAAKYNEGAQLYDRALELDPEDFTLPPKAKFMAGRALVESGRYSEGISQLREAIQLDPEAAHSYNALGIAHMKLGQWDDALANFRAASERAEKWVYPHYNTALVHIARQGYRDAEREFHKGIELGTELGLKYSYLHYNLGILYLDQGRYKEAEQQFRRTIEMMPDDALSYYNLGLLFEQRGEMRQAEAYFRTSADLDARLVEPRLKLAEIYRKQRRRELQESMLRQAVAGDPRSVRALEALGQFLLEGKRLEEAEQVFMQMMVNNPAAAASYSWLGDVHAAQRNFQQAAEDYRQGMARTRDPKLLRELQRKLRSVERKK